MPQLRATRTSRLRNVAKGFNWLALLLLMALPIPVAAATLTIDGSQTYQTIDGFGLNANHRSWTSNELKPSSTP